MDLMTKRKLAMAFLLVMGVLLLLQMVPFKEQMNEQKTEQETVVVLTDAAEKPQNSISQPETAAKEIVVHVAGAVKNPGVYVLHEGQRVEDAIQKAVLAEDADADALNRAAVVTDSQKIIVPFAGEVHSIEQQAIEKQQSDNIDISNNTDNQMSVQQVNLNQATLTQLMALPGVGQVKAGAIVTYRQEHGRFQSVEELLQVNGIGPAIYAQLEPLVFV